jgi:hypothetical protein
VLNLIDILRAANPGAHNSMKHMPNTRQPSAMHALLSTAYPLFSVKSVTGNGRVLEAPANRFDIQARNGEAIEEASERRRSKCAWNASHAGP